MGLESSYYKHYFKYSRLFHRMEITWSSNIYLYFFQLKPFAIDLHSDMTLAALFAGVFIGVGLGITFRFGGTTGGVDIIARIVNKYIGWSMGKTMFIFDFCVITTSIFTYLKI